MTVGRRTGGTLKSLYPTKTHTPRERERERQTHTQTHPGTQTRTHIHDPVTAMSPATTMLCTVVLATLLANTMACSCFPKSFEAQASESTDVFRVRIVKRMPLSTADKQATKLERSTAKRKYIASVKKVFRGCETKGNLVILESAVSSAACGITSLSGAGSWLIMANRDTSSDCDCASDSVPVYSVSLCSGTAHFSAVSFEQRQILKVQQRLETCTSRCTKPVVPDLPLPKEPEPQPEPEAQSPCADGQQPLTSQLGSQLFCGRGVGRVDCPTGSECVIDPTDRFAVCCPTPSPPVVEEPSKCPFGAPLTDGKDELFCGRGVGRVDCPAGSTCMIHQTDRFAVCCPDES
eukprot:m.167234 g.167234  ORF g.167234 m.167234 type:complete len:349 (+) comp17766_c0_seq7:598-1644(+)